MRVVFFGTPTFALPTLERLIAAPEMTVVGVVSQPDRPQGRGKRLQPTPVKALASEHGLPIWQPARLRRATEVLDALAALQADAFVVVAYGQILSPQVLAMPRLGCVNVHGSLLPAYRGAAPIQWAIAKGETETGITTMLMDEGLDTGAMLLKARLPITPTTQAEALADQLAPLGAELLLTTLQGLEAGTLTPEPQPDGATYAPLIRKEDYWLDWSRPAAHLHNQIRGFYPDCYTTWQGTRLKVGQTAPPSGEESPGTPGEVLRIIKQGVEVATGQGTILLQEVQLAGKRRQTASEFANGSRLQPGEILGT